MKQGVDKLSVQYRYAEIDRGKIVADDRTVEVAFSSETPVERWWGTEILDHGAGSVRMARMKNGAASLMNHDTEQLIGVVEEARIDSDKVGRAKVRFGNSALAKEKYQDVQDGILRHISVGYMVHKIETTTDGKGGNEVDRVTDWEPVEISFVAVPADPTVGVGRSAEVREFPVAIDRKEVKSKTATAVEEKRMPEPTQAAAAAEVPNYGPVAAQIMKLGREYNIDAAPYLEKQASIDEVKTIFADIVLARAKEKGKTSGVAENVTENLTETERQEYSVVRA
jgi:HK97 family phage prohead protease